MIKKEILELHKPSELCQVVCLDEHKNLVGSLTSLQIDLMNYMLYRSNEKIQREEIKNIDEFFTLQIPLSDFNNFIGLNNNHVYNHVIDNIIKLKLQLFVFNALNKNKVLENTITSFIHKIKYTKHKMKEIHLTLDGEIIKMLLNTKSMFTKFYLKIQFSMTSKYSKLLYEVLRDYLGRDYKGCSSKIIDLELLHGILNVDTTKKSNNNWSSFRANILEKAINEINEKSDIHVTYETIKEKVDGGRLQVTKLKFNMQQQPTDRLKILGLLNQPLELSPEEQEHYNKKKAIALIRLEKAKKFQTIENEEAWLKKTIESITDAYLDEQEVIVDCKESLDGIDIKKYSNLLMQKYKDVIGIKDYKLYYVFEDKFITNNAKETFDILYEMSEELKGE